MTRRDAQLHELYLLWIHYFDALNLSGVKGFSACERVIDAAFARGQKLSRELDELAALCEAAQTQLERQPPDPARDHFVVRHYGDDPHPTIKGNGFDGLVVGNYREEAEDFIRWVNDLIDARNANGDEPQE